MSNVGGRIKAVFDTGIVLQAALSEVGPSFASFHLMERERIVVVLSPQVREEYEDVLTRPAIRVKNPLLTEERAQQFLARMDARAQAVTVIRPYLQYPRDPQDEPILNLAIQEQVEYLVARDRDLLELGQSADFRLLYPFIKIVNPLTFVREVEQEREREQTPEPQTIVAPSEKPAVLPLADKPDRNR